MRARHRHFNPRGLGAKLVLDARYIDQSDNTAVSTWSDRSGNAWDASQATPASQPTFQTAEFGGNGIVRFDGSNDRLNVTGAGSVHNNVAGGTLMAVARYNANGGQGAISTSVSGSTSTRSRITSNTNVTGYETGGRRLDANGYQGIGGQTPSNTRILIQTGVFDWANSDLFLFLDGGQAASSTSFQTDGNTSATNSNEVVVGGGASGSSNVDVGQALIFDIALNASQRKRTEHAAAFSFKIACS